MTMASKLFPLCNFFLLLMLFSYSPLASSSTSPGTICNSTPHPSFCKSNLPPNEFNTIQDYGWYFIHQSLSSAKDFLSLIKSYTISHSSYSKRTVHALKDCQLLADLTVDFLSKTLQTISSTNRLNSLQAEDLQTLLSATLTNQETCSNGLLELASDSSVKKGLLGPLSNGTKLHSISLALFKHGWVPKTKRESFPTERNHLLFSNMENIINGLLPLRMSITGRWLLQTTLGDVLVSQTVFVNPDGSGDFTTINDAVAACKSVFYFKYSSSVAYDLYQEPSIASYGVINLLLSNGQFQYCEAVVLMNVTQCHTRFGQQPLPTKCTCCHLAIFLNLQNSDWSSKYLFLLPMKPIIRIYLYLQWFQPSDGGSRPVVTAF